MRPARKIHAKSPNGEAATVAAPAVRPTRRVRAKPAAPHGARLGRRPASPVITRIRIANFKSFRDVEMRPGMFSVIVGANASGKSNLAEAFRFLRDAAQRDLDEAVSMHGGAEHFSNVKIGAGRETTFEIEADFPDEHSPYAHFRGVFDHKPYNLLVHKATYAFSLAASRGGRYEVTREDLLMDATDIRGLRTQNRERIEVRREENVLILRRGGKDHRIFHGGPGRPRKSAGGSLMISPRPDLGLVDNPFGRLFARTRVYDFEPKRSKAPVDINNPDELQGHGGNLSLVIKKILSDRRKKAKLIRLAKDTLPFIKRIGADHTTASSVMFYLTEDSYGRAKFPSPFVSDGTAAVLDLVVALFFGNGAPVMIEGPEQTMHPYLLHRAVDTMRDVSANRQVLITTHSPQLVKFCKPDELVLIQRTDDGHSKITRPGDSADVKNFLAHEVGLDELLADDLLGD